MIFKKVLNYSAVSFIGAYYLDEKFVCDELIDYFKASPDLHTRGVINTLGGERDVNPEVKDSVDIYFPPDSAEPVFARYLRELQKCLVEYTAEYPYCDAYAAWSITEGTNLQHYPPGGGYKSWHTERNNAEPVIASRHLAFMTYLNTVADAGETEFFHQKLKVQPEKGLTLVWPADWTFTHRGIVSPTQDKYIITGWLNFLPPG